MGKDWQHFDFRELTLLDLRIMKALALKAGVEDKSYMIRNGWQPKYVGLGVFSYRGWLFIGRGHTYVCTGGFTDLEGYISFVHISLRHVYSDSYRDMIKRGISRWDSEVIRVFARAGSNRLVWRVFRYLLRRTQWWRRFRNTLDLLESAIQIVESAILDETFGRFRLRPVRRSA